MCIEPPARQTGCCQLRYLAALGLASVKCLFGQCFIPEAVPQHQRLLNLATATINTSKQRNPIFATPSIRQLSGNISCSFICLMVGMRMSRLLSMFWLLVGADPSNAKSKPVLTQRLAQPHSEVCQSLQGLASSSMNFVSCRTCSSCIACASATGSLPGNGPPQSGKRIIRGEWRQHSRHRT